MDGRKKLIVSLQTSHFIKTKAKNSNILKAKEG